MPARQLESFSVFSALVLLAVTVSAPAVAHKEHKKPVQTERAMAAPGAVSLPDPNAMHAQIGGMMKDTDPDRSRMSTAERLLDWLGRLDPVIVHFPIAFFPAALFTAIVSRRRPAFAAHAPFLLVKPTHRERLGCSRPPFGHYVGRFARRTNPGAAPP
jgi:hypothetical protein